LSTIEKIREIAQKVVESEGLELYDVELHKGGKRWIVRIFIDKPGGVGINDCALISRQVGIIMDVEDVIPHSYLLQVSSPGLTRALRKEEDFRKSVGQLAKIKTLNLIEGRRKFVGRIKAISHGNIILWDKEKEEEITIPLDNIRKANLEFIAKGD